MVESSSLVSFWPLLFVQSVGLVATLAARRGCRRGLRGYLQIVSLMCMTLAGLGALASASSNPCPCLLSGTMFACMVLTATFDHRGLRPELGDFV